MAISYSLAPNPKWYIADFVGRPLAGGYLATFSNQNHTLFNPVFKDPNGLNVWPYVIVPNVGVPGILFDENGAQGPFYFQFDSSLPDQLYYLEVYDANGVRQWTIDDFSPGSGGGSIITTALDLENLIANNVFWRNIGTTPISPGTFLKLAPGAHSALAQTPANAGPDICFIKNNTSATDTVSFPKFPLGSAPFIDDVTPVDYLNYDCTGAGSAETKKLVQFPITHSVQNLSNQTMTVTVWARATAGSSPTLTLQWYQFFGDGPSASPAIITPIQVLSLASSWQKFEIPTVIPSVTGNVLGECGNDALFLQAQYPLGVTCSIDFTKPCVYLGNISPDQDYHTYDMIDTIINSPRTGDIRVSVNNHSPFGWVFMNDGTLGNDTSGATARANIDTFPLYNYIWNNVSRSWAPIVGATTGTAIGDFSTGLPLYLTRALGRVFAGTLNTEVSQTFTYASSNPTSTLTVGSTASFIKGVPVTLSNSGGALPTGLSAGVTYYAINLSGTTMQLASSLANALSGTPITFNGTTGTGTQTVTVTPYALGQFAGEETHVLTIPEMPSHSHMVPQSFAITNASSGGGVNAASSGTEPVTSTGGGLGHNTIQPTTYMNFFIKL